MPDDNLFNVRTCIHNITLTAYNVNAYHQTNYKDSTTGVFPMNSIAFGLTRFNTLYYDFKRPVS